MVKRSAPEGAVSAELVPARQADRLVHGLLRSAHRCQHTRIGTALQITKLAKRMHTHTIALEKNANWLARKKPPPALQSILCEGRARQMALAKPVRAHTTALCRNAHWFTCKAPSPALHSRLSTRMKLHRSLC